MFEKADLGGKKFYGFGCPGPDTEFFNTISPKQAEFQGIMVFR